MVSFLKIGLTFASLTVSVTGLAITLAPFFKNLSRSLSIAIAFMV